jgi:protein-tyrosine kinase
MTIQDALERAKQLRKTREGNTSGRSERAQAAREETGVYAIAREAVTAGPVASVEYADLERVEFDSEACLHHKILFTSEQMAESAQAAAAYRLMRSRALHRFKGGNWSCIGITSPGAGEGKTVTTLNLAISIARERQRMVYVLDLDMRNPSVFESVGAQPSQALSRFFTEGAAPERVLYATSVENLVIAGNRDAVQGASELLATPRLDELIQHIKRRSPGALILADLPPVLSTDEALVVAPRMDAMFIVVSEGITRRDSLAKSVDVLSDFTVAGIIMNRSSDVAHAGYYGY